MRKVIFCAALALVVVAVFGVAINREEEEEQVLVDDAELLTREKRQASGSGAKKAATNSKKKVVTCQTMSFAALSKCCKVPPGKLFSDDKLTKCNAKRNDPGLFSWCRDYKINVATNAKRKNALEIHPEKSRKMMGNAACLVECAYKNDNLLNDDGRINFDAAKAYVVNAAGAEWKEKIALLADNCKNYETDPNFMTNVTKIAKPGNTGTECTLFALAFQQCLRRKVPDNCPSVDGGNGYNEDNQTCKSQGSAIKKCNPNGGIATTTTAAPEAGAAAASATTSFY